MCLICSVLHSFGCVLTMWFVVLCASRQGGSSSYSPIYKKGAVEAVGMASAVERKCDTGLMSAAQIVESQK